MIYILSTSAFQILEKLSDNAYVIDLPESFDIISIFNIENLVDYKGPIFDPSNSLNDEPFHELISEWPFLPLLSNILPNTTPHVDNILDDEIITTKDGRARRYLVRWKRKPPTDYTWVDWNELQ